MRFRLSLLPVLVLLAMSMPAMAAPTPSLEELWRVVQQQQATIEQLNKKLDTTLAQLAQTETKLAGTETKLASTETRVADHDKKIEATADAVEAKAGSSAASSSPSWADRTSVGGYGELHYNHLDNDGVGGDLNRTDFHRFVLYLNHEFNSWLRFGSELEVEHVVVSSDEDDPGEVELEQAWLEMDLNDNTRLRTGLDILPVGIINQTHEPNTFYGVERNPVESEIIPATWAGKRARGFPAKSAPASPMTSCCIPAWSCPSMATKPSSCGMVAPRLLKPTIRTSPSPAACATPASQDSNWRPRPSTRRTTPARPMPPRLRRI